MYNYDNEDSNPDFSNDQGYTSPGPNMAHNINTNITNIIDDIKKQRMDIIKLNNEIRNSRGLMNKKSSDDIKYKGEFINLANSLKRERDSLLAELKSIKKKNSSGGADIREVEMKVKEMKSIKSEYLVEINEKDKEIEELKKDIAGVNKLLDEKKNDTMSHEAQKELIEDAEKRMQQYFDKYKQEMTKKGKLTHEIQEFKDNISILKNDNERLSIKLKQLNDANKKLKLSMNSGQKELEEEFKEELALDLESMLQLRENMDAIISHMEVNDV